MRLPGGHREVPHEAVRPLRARFLEPFGSLLCNDVHKTQPAEDVGVPSGTVCAGHGAGLPVLRPDMEVVAVVVVQGPLQDVLAHEAKVLFSLRVVELIAVVVGIDHQYHSARR